MKSKIYAYDETSLRYMYIYINKSNGNETMIVSSTSHRYLSYILLEGNDFPRIKSPKQTTSKRLVIPWTAGISIP